MTFSYYPSPLTPLLRLVERVLALLFFWLLSVSSSAQTAPSAPSAPLAPPLQTIRIASQEGVPYLTEPIQRVLIEAYRRIGIKAEIVPNVPITRAAVDTNSGFYDAALAGNANAGDKQPNTLHTKEPVYWVEYGTFAIKTVPPDQVSNWAALKASSLRIGGRQGHLLLTLRLGERGFYGVASDDSLLRMLLADRIDIMLGTTNSLTWEMANGPADLAEQISKVRQVSTLERVPMYHYLNKKHADLVPRLDEALRKMESDGTMAKLLGKSGRK